MLGTDLLKESSYCSVSPLPTYLFARDCGGQKLWPELGWGERKGSDSS